MNLNSFALLYNDFMAAVNDPDRMIDFYHKNAVFLNNITTLNNKDDLGSYIQISNKYAGALYQRKRFSKVIEFANDKMPFIDSEITRLNAPELKDGWYYYILFFKAASLYNKRDFKAAHPLFIELTEYDQKDEVFKNWLNYSDHSSNFSLLNILTWIFSIVLLGNMLIADNISGYKLKSLLSNVALVGLIGSLGYEFYLKRKLKKLG